MKALLASLALSPAVHAADWRAQRTEFRAALGDAENGQLDPAQARRLAGHPLHSWLEVIALRKNVGSATPAQVEAVLARVGNQPSGAWLREAWLAELAKRRDWPAFRKSWTGSDDPALRCAHLSARADANAIDDKWIDEARERTVHLPLIPGGWYDFWSGKRVVQTINMNGGTIAAFPVTAAAPFDEMPVLNDCVC